MVALMSPSVTYAATADELRAAIIQTLEQLIERIEDQIEDLLEAAQNTDDEDEEVEEEEEDDDDDDTDTTSAVTTSAEGRQDSNGDTVRAIFEVSFQLRAFGDTMYIPAAASLNDTDDGITYVIEGANGQTISGITADNINSAIFTATADRITEGSDDYFRIDANDSETFTLTVEVDSNGGSDTGAMRMQAMSIRFADDPNDTMLNFDLRPRNEFETDFVTIDA